MAHIGERIGAGGLGGARRDGLPLGTRIALVLSVAILLAATVVSTGPVTLDELIYLMAADAFARTGGFVVGNGWETFGADALKLWFLVDGPDGLVPQYPPGAAILTWPMYAAFGTRGLVLSNAAAAGGVLVLTAALTRRVGGDERTATLAVALLAGASFLTDYAFAIWPHALALLMVLGALLLAVRALDGPVGPALAAGSLAGAAVTVRADSVLVFGALGAVAILYAARPVATLAAGAAGAAPFALCMAVVNHAKFGTWSPLSYGSRGGGDDPATHLPAAALAVVGLAALVAARTLRWTPARRGWTAAGLAAASAIAVALVPEVRGVASRAAAGLYHLGVDVTLAPDGRAGVAERAADGTRLFWGLPKKALLQSLPWLGLIAFGLCGPWGAARRWVVAGGLVAAVWMLPFVPRSWHGGLGLNLRYFLPLLPLAAIAAAAVAVRLSDRAGIGPRPLILAALGGALLVTAWAALLPSGLAGAHQIVTRWAAVALVLLGLAAAWHPGLRPALLAAAAATVGMAAAVGPLGDVRIAQAHRAMNAAAGEGLSGIEGPVLFLGRPEIASGTVGRDDVALALGSNVTGKFDISLVRSALARGWRVVGWGEEARLTLAAGDMVRIGGWTAGGIDIVEIGRRPGG